MTSVVVPATKRSRCDSKVVILGEMSVKVPQKETLATLSVGAARNISLILFSHRPKWLNYRDYEMAHL